MAQTLKAAHQVLAQFGIVESTKTKKPCWPSTTLHSRLLSVFKIVISHGQAGGH